MTLKAIKAKIKSVKNLKKITRALEVVSTVKLQKTKDQAEHMREYLKDLLFVLAAIGQKVDLFSTYKKLDSDKELYILVTSDRGLCGNLNSKLLRKFYEETKDKKDKVDVFVVGKKGLEYTVRMGYNVVGNINLKDNFTEQDLLGLYAFLDKDILNYSKAYIYFNYFKNTLVQIPTRIEFFPLSKEIFEEFVSSLDIKDYKKPAINGKDLIIEPDVESLLKEVRRQIRNYLIYSAILQNKTGEHAARMIAMKNAKDNSEKMIKSLTLSFNKARQAAITKEISEITSAKMAIEENNI